MAEHKISQFIPQSSFVLEIVNVHNDATISFKKFVLVMSYVEFFKYDFKWFVDHVNQVDSIYT